MYKGVAYGSFETVEMVREKSRQAKKKKKNNKKWKYTDHREEDYTLRDAYELIIIK